MVLLSLDPSGHGGVINLEQPNLHNETQSLGLQKWVENLDERNRLKRGGVTCIPLTTRPSSLLRGQGYEYQYLGRRGRLDYHILWILAYFMSEEPSLSKYDLEIQELI